MEAYTSLGSQLSSVGQNFLLHRYSSSIKSDKKLITMDKDDNEENQLSYSFHKQNPSTEKRLKGKHKKGKNVGDKYILKIERVAMRP